MHIFCLCARACHSSAFLSTSLLLLTLLHVLNFYCVLFPQRTEHFSPSYLPFRAADRKRVELCFLYVKRRRDKRPQLHRSPDHAKAPIFERHFGQWIFPEFSWKITGSFSSVWSSIIHIIGETKMLEHDDDEVLVAPPSFPLLLCRHETHQSRSQIRALKRFYSSLKSDDIPRATVILTDRTRRSPVVVFHLLLWIFLYRASIHAPSLASYPLQLRVFK